MKAKYLLRFDDICATMNWSVWNEIEKVLRRANVKPIVAVVPDNRDPKLKISAASPDFWNKVREWQRLGWTIGLHGYQHLYVTRNPGLIGLKQQSEFAGLPLKEQEEKIEAAAAIFRREGVTPDIWTAPGHSFDENTLKCLKKTGITVISDGFYPAPVVKAPGVTWIPQQLWNFHDLPFGVWTVCYHPNAWTAEKLTSFSAVVSSRRHSLASLDETLKNCKIQKPGAFSRSFSVLWRAGIKLRTSFHSH